MIRCYLLALCRASSLDAETSNFSLFSLVEAIQMVPFVPRAIVPIEVHAYFEAENEDVGTECEMRGVWISETGVETVGEAINALPITSPRPRTRAMSLRLPPSIGSYKFGIEWRQRGAAAWVREAACWPLTIHDAPVPVPANANA
jgi:hypothetical protein